MHVVRQLHADHSLGQPLIMDDLCQRGHTGGSFVCIEALRPVPEALVGYPAGGGNGKPVRAQKSRLQGFVAGQEGEEIVGIEREYFAEKAGKVAVVELVRDQDGIEIIGSHLQSQPPVAFQILRLGEFRIFGVRHRHSVGAEVCASGEGSADKIRLNFLAAPQIVLGNLADRRQTA